jgi:hypothetical protein
MKRKDLIFIAVLVAVVAIFIFLSQIGRKPAALTSRPEHAGLGKKTPPETCLACHAPDSTVAPMPVNHPKKGRPPDEMKGMEFKCFTCHRPPAETTAMLITSNKTGNKELAPLWLYLQERNQSRK